VTKEQNIYPSPKIAMPKTYAAKPSSSPIYENLPA